MNIVQTIAEKPALSDSIYRYGSKTSQVLELGVNERALYYDHDHASKCDPQESRV